MASMASASPTLIGRDAELRELSSWLGVATPAPSAGSRQHVLLSGDAGVGKTRLLEELAAKAAGAGWQVYIGHCLDFGDSALPYLPLSEILDGLVGQHTEIVDRVAHAYPALTRLQPVRRMLGLTEAPDETLDRGQLFEAVHALLGAVADTSPTLVIVEDAHWADQSTRDLLTFLFARPYACPVGLVASYRVDDLHRRHPLRRQVAEWARLPAVERVVVAPLNDTDSRALVAALNPDLDELKASDVVARAEGNAFFVEELVGAADNPEGWVSDDLAGVLLVRLDRLDDASRQVVRTAAVSGRNVDHDLLVRVTDLADADLDEALRHAVESHVLVAGDGQYSFRHALLGEAVYDDLLPGERVRIHARYAAAIGADSALGSAAELARHARQAMDLDTALAASIRAGDEAVAVGGPDEAAAHYERALRLLTNPSVTLPEGITLTRVAESAIGALLNSGQVDRAARLAQEQLDRLPPETADADRARLLTGRGIALGLLDTALEDSVAASEQAVKLSEDAEPPLRARVLANHAQVLSWAGHAEDAERAGLEALALAERHALPDVASAAMTTISALGRTADPTALREALEAAIGRAVAADAFGAELQGRYLLARSYEDHGEWPLAEEWFRGVAERAASVGQPWAPYALEARLQLSWVLFVLGRWDDAMELLSIIGPSTPPIPYALLDSVRLAIRQARGERVPVRIHRAVWPRDGAIPIFIVATEIAAATEPAQVLGSYADAVETLSQVWHPYFVGRIRIATVTLGRIADMVPDLPSPERAALVPEAERLLADGRTTRERYDDKRGWGPEGQAWEQRLVAEELRVRWLAGADAPSAGELVEAWEETERRFVAFGHVHELATVRVVLAGILRATGDTARSRAFADQARETAEALGAKLLLDRLADLGAAPARAETPDALTPREAEILALVAEGRSNGEIGKQLFISTKTVSVHVSNILAKLGATGRTEAAAIARRKGLL